ncbi:hypothetical protein [Mycolicibacterium aichiense]|uniref:Uncharacterized protein n=1 Tax=Mycolicibacterium aichiense TaxID=1799 RepID=A0AAD1HMT9_9MYCO|nr:hypothetical protein [Mycolicibacterium aichiense]MCV7019476.1 hypothetical protein [Mycolicibacterium aichiense]BBX08215.1 hypothetical protein MAIC_30180 [Mycolicibacterium aichiense]STZ82019.1 Uncharacterised protein [Mycolicibacterium aichiense]
MNWLALTRAGFGVAVLVAPDEVAGHVGDRDLSNGTRTAMRILGGRLLAESAVCALRPTRCVLKMEAVVDVIHGVTMGGVAVLSRNDSRRRAAGANVATATAFTVADVIAVRRHEPPSAPESITVLQWRNTLAERLCQWLLR